MSVIFQTARAIVALDVAVSRPGLVIVNGPPGLGHREVVRAWLRRTNRSQHLHVVKTADDVRALLASESFVVTEVAVGTPIDLCEIADTALDQGIVCVVVLSEPEPPQTPAEATSLPAATFVMTHEEVVERLTEHGIDPGVADALAVFTAGWPGLLHPIVTDHADPDRLLPALVEPLVQELIRRVLLPWLPKSWHDTLRYLAVAGSASPAELAKVPNGGVACQAMISLELAPPTSRPDDDYGVALIPALRAVIDDRGREASSRERTLERIADIRFELGEADCGLRAAFELMDWDRCAAILDRWWQRGLRNGYRDLGDEVLRALPGEYLRQFPMVAQRAEYVGILPLGSVELRIPENSGDIDAVLRDGTATRLMERSLLAIVTRYMAGKDHEAAGLAQKMAPIVQLATRVPGNGSRELSTFWHVHACLAAEMAGDEAAAQQFLTQGWNDREWDESGSATQDVVAHMALLCAARGELNNARRWLGRFEDLPPVEDWTASYVNRHVRLTQHILAWDALDPGAPNAGILMEDVYASDTIWPYAFGLATGAALASDDAEEVITLADGAESAHFLAARSDGIAPRVLQASRAFAYLSLGQASRASIALGTVAVDDQFGAPVHATLLLVTDRLDEAAAYSLRAARRATFSPRARRRLRLIAAAALTALGRTDEAFAPLSQALLEAEKEHDRRLVTLIPERFRTEIASAFPAHSVQVRAGRSVLPDEVTWVTLTERETVILKELARGKVLRQIAETNYISKNTVKTQVRSIYAKLNVSSRAEAIAVAEQLGLLGKR